MRGDEDLNPREFAERAGLRSVAICLSGGRDSLVACHYTLSELEGLDLERHVVWVDTTAMLPGTREYVEEVCERFGWPLTILKPRRTFEELVSEWGFPTMRRRWCCYHLKLEPIARFMRELPAPRAEVVGLRRSESRRRAKLEQVIWKPKSASWGYAPILYWSDEDVRRYVREHKLPEPPHYRLGIRETCWCGAFKSLKEVRILRAQFPEFFKRFVEMETRFESGGAAFFINNKPTYARDILKQHVLDEWIEGDCGEDP